MDSILDQVLHYETTPPRATITIDDEEHRNPLSNASMVEMTALVSRAASDEEVRVIVITGAGDQAFSAGGDLGGGFVDRPLADHAARFDSAVSGGSSAVEAVEVLHRGSAYDYDPQIVAALRRVLQRRGVIAA